MHHKEGFFIKNILVLGGDNGKNGEYFKGHYIYLNKKPIIFNDGIIDNSRAERIVKQIVLIGDYAVKHHNIERLTRIITDEFSFYTRSTPLSLEEYKFIINMSAEKLKNLPANIVMVISSMPVLWSDGTLRNAVLHIQSPNQQGSFPIIHHFSKENASKMDPCYAKVFTPNITEQDCYQFRKDDYLGIHSPDKVLQDTRVNCLDSDQYKNNIVVRGLNLPPIIETIDICLDHCNQVGMRNVKPLLERISNNNENIIFHISHIITSHCTPPFESALLASPIIADYLNKRAGDVTESKAEKQLSYFGDPITIHIFHQMRAEVINSQEFNLAAYKMYHRFDISLHSLVDNYHNTLLHQIFLPNKTSTRSTYQFHQLKAFEKIIPYFWNEGINQQNNNGDTALHLALKIIDDPNVLIYFLTQGARLDIKNKNNQSPIKFAYENNKINLAQMLISKLINNVNVYLANQAHILEIINDIPSPDLKRKVAASALCFEMSHLTHEKIDEEKVIELLMIVDDTPVKLFIKHNIGQLLSTFKKGILYCYLVNNLALQENHAGITILPASVQAHLLELELKNQVLNNNNSTVTDIRSLNNIKLFKKGLTQLLRHLPAPDRKIVQNNIQHAIKNISIQELKNNITDIEISIEREVNILMKNDKLINKILAHLPKIQDDQIKIYILQEFIQQNIYLEILKNEIKNISPTSEIVQLVWTKLADYDFCDEDNNLTITEQILMYALKIQDSALLDKVFLRSPQSIDFTTIDKITATQGIHKLYSQKWFLENIIQNEIKKFPHIRLNTIFYILSLYPIIDLNQRFASTTFTIGHQLIALAFQLNNPSLLDKVIQLLPQAELHIDYIVNEVSKLFNFNIMIKSWLYENLLKNEVNPHKLVSNINIINAVLSQPIQLINYQQLLNFGQIIQLTLAESLIAVAYKQCNSQLLERIKLIFPMLFQPFIIDKIAFHISFLDLALDRRIHEWIYQALIKNEIKKGKWADIYFIIAGLPFCDPDDFSHTPLPIGQQLIAQAYTSNNLGLLDAINFHFPFLINTRVFDNIAATFMNQVHVKHWIYVGLIRNELTRQYQANMDRVFFALSNSSSNLLNEQSEKYPLTIGERLFVQAFYTNNSLLFFKTLHLYSIHSQHVDFPTLFQKLTTTISFPQEGIRWLQQQIELITSLLQNLANTRLNQKNQSTAAAANTTNVISNPISHSSITLFSPPIPSQQDNKNNSGPPSYTKDA